MIIWILVKNNIFKKSLDNSLKTIRQNAIKIILNIISYLTTKKQVLQHQDLFLLIFYLKVKQHLID